MDKTPRALVEQFVAFRMQQGQQEADALATSLCANGVDSEQAECLIAFVPMAAAHVLLARRGATLPDTYLLHDPSTGRSVRGSLGDEPIYEAGRAWALAMLADASNRNQVELVAADSAEMNCLRELEPDSVSRDSDLHHIGFVESQLLRVPRSHLPASPSDDWLDQFANSYQAQQAERKVRRTSGHYGLMLGIVLVKVALIVVGYFWLRSM